MRISNLIYFILVGILGLLLSSCHKHMPVSKLEIQNVAMAARRGDTVILSVNDDRVLKRIVQMQNLQEIFSSAHFNEDNLHAAFPEGISNFSGTGDS